MARQKNNDYQQRFVRLCFRYLPHHSLLHMATALHSHYFIARLNNYAKQKIVGPSVLPEFTAADLNVYQRVTKATALWHGTGRYQHQGGAKVDVLESMLRAEALKPVEDAYAIFGGGKLMHSISLTKLRMIARSYADMHGDGFRETHRYGNALMWTAYHYGMFYARIYGLHFATVRRYYKTWHSLTHDENGHNTWGKKVNLAAEDVWDAFGLGSDIKGNYPIVIGLKRLDGAITLPPYFADYEVRVSRNISLSDITHLEVPQDRIAETSRVLRAWHADIPIVSIEVGEAVAASQPFNELIGV